jgi:hypothetical protein
MSNRAFMYDNQPAVTCWNNQGKPEYKHFATEIGTAAVPPQAAMPTTAEPVQSKRRPGRPEGSFSEATARRKREMLNEWDCEHTQATRREPAERTAFIAPTPRKSLTNTNAKNVGNKYPCQHLSFFSYIPIGLHFPTRRPCDVGNNSPASRQDFFHG